MNKSTKWVIGSVGLAICFYVGWFVPMLWLLWLALVVVIIAVPTKPDAPESLPIIRPMHVQAPSSDTITQLESMIAAEKDEKVKEGLHRALSVIRDAQPVAPHYNSMEGTPAPARPVISQSELDEQKKRQELRNVNTILYTASFLLVGAAALFIGFNDQAGPTVKFATLLVVAGLFYVSGLVLHDRSVKLLPAATAFVGTGLALIPFVGLAFNSFVIHDAPLSWFLTSLLGLGAFLLAVYKLRSTVMAYLTLAFVFSLATSTVSVLDSPFIWYFVSIIATGSLLTYVMYKLPNLVPSYFKKPLEDNIQLATPVALVGSVLMAGTFTSFEYAMVSGVAALHYLVMTVAYSSGSRRFFYWTAARALLVVFVSALTYYLTDDWTWASAALLVSGILAHIYSVTQLKHEPREAAWLWAGQGLVAVSLTGWLDEPIYVSLSLAILLVMSLLQLHATRRAEYAALGVLAAVILPLSTLRGIADPSVGYDVIAIICLAIGALLLLARWLAVPRHVSYRQALSLFYVSFIVLAIVLAAISSQWIVFGSVMVLAGVFVHIASYVEREETLTIGSNIMLLIGVFTLYGQWFDSYTWVPLASGLTLGAVWYGLSWYHRRPEAVAPDDELRSIIMSLSAIGVLAVASLIVMFQTEQTIVAGALLGCLTAGVVAYEGMVRKRLIGFEIAAYIATFSLQRLVAHVYPDADWLIYTHWWAFTTGAVALLRYNRTGNREQAMVRGILALTLFSLPTALAALVDGTGMYRMIFLLEHVALAMIGLALNKKLAVRWGAIGIGLAVLYMLKGYTYLLLVLIALALIALAVWRLNKKG